MVRLLVRSAVAPGSLVRPLSSRSEEKKRRSEMPLNGRVDRRREGERETGWRQGGREGGRG